MITTQPHAGFPHGAPPGAALKRAAVRVLAAATAAAWLGSLLPAVLTPVPVAAFLPEPPPVVARTASLVP
jgi:hypothetical protein